jgi:hypothetical protein
MVLRQYPGHFIFVQNLKRNNMSLHRFYMCMMCNFRNRTAYNLCA